jgi:hypothetical protein
MSYELDRPKTAVDPGHYRVGKVELIDLIEQLTFNVGNAVKYLVRAGRKSESPDEDLKKAIWYARRELFRLTGEDPEAAALKAREAEIADYERTVAALREQLRAEEARRASYQAIAAG